MLLRHDHIRQQPWILASTCPERDFAFALELGLHPLAMAKVGAMIKVLSTDKQVIVATQSPLLVDAFCVDELFVLEMEQGKTEARKLHVDQFQPWLDDGDSPGELWRKSLLGGWP